MASHRRAIYPGTFDPPHRGHVDLIRRGAALVDELIVAVARNREKRPAFSAEERVSLLERACGDVPGIRVLPFDGLVVDLYLKEGASFLLRGIRTFADFEAEYTMALTNRALATGPEDQTGGAGAPAETVFVLPSLEFSHFSSRHVKEIAAFGGDIARFLPPEILPEVEARLRPE
ncbi:MAG: pantetheine-phosphate adenylyltransferase [Planctomycetota bacterium]